MKINIYQTVEVSEEQRTQLGAVIDGKVKPKRTATRDELKDYIWQEGIGWPGALSELWHDKFTEPEPEEDEPEEDLLGGSDEEDLI